MRTKTFFGYVWAGMAGLLLVAAIILLVLQWGNSASLTVYGPMIQVNTAVLMLLSAAGGVVLVALLRALWGAIRTIRSGRREERIDQAAKAARNSSSRKADQSSASENADQ